MSHPERRRRFVAASVALAQLAALFPNAAWAQAKVSAPAGSANFRAVAAPVARALTAPTALSGVLAPVGGPAASPAGVRSPLAAAAPSALPPLPAAAAADLPPSAANEADPRAARPAPTSAEPAAPTDAPANESPAAPPSPAATGRLQAVRSLVARSFGALRAAFGADRKPQELPAAAPSSDATPPAPNGLKPAAKLAKPIVVTLPDGTEHPLSYDPAAPRAGFFTRLYRGVIGLPETVRRVRLFMKRVKASVDEEITDENLRWSINRLETMQNQEGILRNKNQDLKNAWPKVKLLKFASHDDLAGSSLDDEDVMKTFKTAMDLEEPTLQYQFAFAQNLHPLIVHLAHFLGTTLQERILVVALKGRPADMAIWSDEEERHGPLLEKLYERVRHGSRPPLTQQGAGPRLPRMERGAYLALSNMGNRALAELGAASAYLVLRANAKAGSPMEAALEGIYRDEVYHYAIMQLVSKWALGQHSRWVRLYRLFRHDLDYRNPEAADAVIHQRWFSPTLLFEVAYTILTVDKRVDRFLRTIPEARAKAILGEFNVTDEQIRAAALRKDNTVTKHFRMEQNPELTQADVERLDKRFPGWIVASERKIKASDIKEVVDNYRDNSLTRPDYWMRKKGFTKIYGNLADQAILERPLEGSPGAVLSLFFNGPIFSPIVRIFDRSTSHDAKPLFERRLADLSMLQIGSLMDAEDLTVLQRLEDNKQDLSYLELVKRLNRSAAYQAAPIPLIDDLK